ncbi:mavicyanin-like [Andrographis paniculata]|uniref:mavicyanin-like n=1 Tax=Andrographis paniculata TaxID=175694 RepID=UPI0021E79D29|nr:mavicyanin-like [Andrographis paniculata]
MANSKNALLLLLPIIVLLLSASKSNCLQLQHIVGDSIWTIPAVADFYANWSSSNSDSFHAGDTLYFDFASGLYNVIQVSRGDFDQCSGDQLAFAAFMEGPVVFPLSGEGVMYFVSNVSNYCSLGMKRCLLSTHVTSRSICVRQVSTICLVIEVDVLLVISCCVNAANFSASSPTPASLNPNTHWY